jgi:hypothetical protein
VSDEGRQRCRNGMEWNGMEWNGMEWNGMERAAPLVVSFFGDNVVS